MPKPLQSVEPQEMGAQSLVRERVYKSSMWPKLHDGVRLQLRHSLVTAGCENIKILEPERVWMDPFTGEDGWEYAGEWMWQINAVGERHAS